MLDFSMCYEPGFSDKACRSGKLKERALRTEIELLIV